MKRAMTVMRAAALLLLSLLVCSCSPVGESGEYIYRGYTSALGNNWNPHTWETSADKSVLDYLTTPLVSVLPYGRDGDFRWSYDMAEEVRYVTAEAREDLLKYGSQLPEGKRIEEVDSGYVYEIKLREGLSFEDGTQITAESFVRSMELCLDPRFKNGRANTYLSGEAAIAGAKECFDGVSDFSSVGIYATGEGSFRYVTRAFIEMDYFLSSLTSSWLVNEEMYLRGVSKTGELYSTDYGTSVTTTSSYGPYKLVSHQGEKEMVFERNEAWFGWERDEQDRLVSHVDLGGDEGVIEQYMTTKIVINVIDSSTAKQLFERGELTEWTPSVSEYESYRYSDALYTAGETYTMSLFFNSNKEDLVSMDRARGNINSVCLSDKSFRKGISLAIDRSELRLATEDYLPEFALLNREYYYDIYKSPTATYRDTEEGKAALLSLYGVRWGEGTPYKTLDAAYKSLTGYDPSGAREEFMKAYRSLTEAGLYREGEEIRIRVAFSKGALSADDNRLVTLLNKYINLAAQGSGFGRITLVPLGRISNRYSAVSGGEYAIGYGAWGGAAFYPFRAMSVYLDPDYENLHEAACWSPKEAFLTLNIGGEEITKSYTDWARSIYGVGEYADGDVGTRLYILSKLEEGFLSFYYRVPLMSSTASTLLSYQVENYTNNHSVMYGFGGFRLLRYVYDDREWQSFVKKNGGRLKYE